MSSPDIQLSPSEENTLQARGYKLLKKLGEGSYAKVYMTAYTTEDEKNPHTLACKVIDTAKAPKDFVRKFLPRELDILVRINHPHIVHVHSIFQRRTKYYVFMRYAENGDLLEFILQNGAIAECQARVWLRQLALGVQYLHELEIAHRDLKCENVLISANFNVKLADFGFARTVVDSKGKRVLSETYCGSLSYAAPEILRGVPYNPKLSDIWSLGIVLYIMLNKAMPFDDTNIKRLHDQQVNRRWKFRSKVTDILSEAVKKLVTNLLEPDVTKRWRLDQILNSEWVAMDPRLLALTAAEQAAVKAATDEKQRRKINIKGGKKSPSTRSPKVSPRGSPRGSPSRSPTRSPMRSPARSPTRGTKEIRTSNVSGTSGVSGNPPPGTGTLTVIKDNKTNVGPVMSENIQSNNLKKNGPAEVARSSSLSGSLPILAKSVAFYQLLMKPSLNAERPKTSPVSHQLPRPHYSYSGSYSSSIPSAACFSSHTASSAGFSSHTVSYNNFSRSFSAYNISSSSYSRSYSPKDSSSFSRSYSSSFSRSYSSRFSRSYSSRFSRSFSSHNFMQ